jgi:hypothetical protein
MTHIVTSISVARRYVANKYNASFLRFAHANSGVHDKFINIDAANNARIPTKHPSNPLTLPLLTFVIKNSPISAYNVVQAAPNTHPGGCAGDLVYPAVSPTSQKNPGMLPNIDGITNSTPFNNIYITNIKKNNFRATVIYSKKHYTQTT